jgi:outer membrane immunogenic protein
MAYSAKVLAAVAVVSISFASAAGAADMAVKAPPVPVVALYSWTGCYIGVEGGGSWGRARSTSNGTNNGVPNGTAGVVKVESDLSGGLIGGTLGCNYQVNRWVFGIEGDGSWSGETGSSFLIPPTFVNLFKEDISQSWMTTIRGRIGYAVTPTVLLYGTAGGAFADLNIHEFNPSVVGASFIGATETHQFSGWTAGAGVEWGFAPHWSAKVEYLYMDLGRQNYFATTATGCCTFQSTHLTDNIVRAGINYRFNWGQPGVVAKY